MDDLMGGEIAGVALGVVFLFAFAGAMAMVAVGIFDKGDDYWYAPEQRRPIPAPRVGTGEHIPSLDALPLLDGWRRRTPPAARRRHGGSHSAREG